MGKCMPHGQSQEVKAAMLLHKAMEYETTRCGEAPPPKGRSSVDADGLSFVTFALDYASTRASLLHSSSKGSSSRIPRHVIRKIWNPNQQWKLIDFTKRSKSQEA